MLSPLDLEFFFYRSFKNLWRDMIISFDAYKISLMIFNLLTASEKHNTETFFLLFVRINFFLHTCISISIYLKYVLLIKKWVYISIFDFFIMFCGVDYNIILYFFSSMWGLDSMVYFFSALEFSREMITSEFTLCYSKLIGQYSENQNSRFLFH